MKKLLKYIPSVVFALVEIGVVLAVLDNANHFDNENIMAGLVLLYASFRSFSISSGLAMDRLLLGLSKDIIDIKERIKKDYDTDEAKERLNLLKENIDKSNARLVIRAIGVGVVYIIALVSLLN